MSRLFNRYALLQRQSRTVTTALGLALILAAVSGCAPALNTSSSTQGKKPAEDIFDPGDFTVPSQPTAKKAAKEPPKVSAAETRPAVKVEPAPETKAETKAEPKPEVKPEPKPEPKPETKAEEKPETKASSVEMVADKTPIKIAEAPKMVAKPNPTPLTGDQAVANPPALGSGLDKPAEKIAAPAVAVSPVILPATPPVPREKMNVPNRMADSYIVQQGDTIYAIGRHYVLPVPVLEYANRLKAPYSLSKGQKLVIPHPKLYTVMAGDTLYSIGRQFGTDIQTIIRMNQMNPPYSVAVGTVIALPDPDDHTVYPDSPAAAAAAPAGAGAAGAAGVAVAKGATATPTTTQTPPLAEPLKIAPPPAPTTTVQPLPSTASAPKASAPAAAINPATKPPTVAAGAAASAASATAPAAVTPAVPLIVPVPVKTATKGEAKDAAKTPAVTDDKALVKTPSPSAEKPPAKQPPAAKEPAQQPAKETAKPSSAASVMDLPVPPLRGGKDFLWPSEGRVAVQFGQKVNGVSSEGIRILVPRGTPVTTSENGTVVYADIDNRSLGKLIIIRHSDGYQTIYGYLDSFSVKRGDVVHRGQSIGKSGQSVDVKKPELYFGITKDSNPVDPAKLLAKP